MLRSPPSMMLGSRLRLPPPPPLPRPPSPPPPPPAPLSPPPLPPFAPLLDGDVRLADGPSAAEGRVEIYHDGQWGTACDDGWNALNTAAVCRQLGYPYWGAHHGGAHYGEGSGPIWIDDVMCSPTAVALSKCIRAGGTLTWGVNNCGHDEDVGVKCVALPPPAAPAPPRPPPSPPAPPSPPVRDGDVRLVGGTHAAEGRLEVYHAGEWGTVCDDEFNKNIHQANAVCRQLGYSGSLRIDPFGEIEAEIGELYGISPFGDGSGSGSGGSAAEPPPLLDSVGRRLDVRSLDWPPPPPPPHSTHSAAGGGCGGGGWTAGGGGGGGGGGGWAADGGGGGGGGGW